ncbi:MAG TPA: YeeE/YedE family protein [Flavobacteriales bacterium]|jgi:uncharacterized membrane protein YedE/YeeE|nr:YeeE/YedE family protein [Flavobacteriales bacterium]
MKEIIFSPWPWWVAGPAIAIVYLVLSYFGKSFGISATMRAACTVAGAGKRVPFFNFDWKSQIWNFIFVLGSVIGGFIAHEFMYLDTYAIDISQSTKEAASSLGLYSFEQGMFPIEVFNWDSLFTLKGFLVMIIGGFLIGFGSRYAGGCTSGHAISGLANLQLPSLIAVIGFFIGGLLVTFYVIPFVYTL